MRAWVALLLAAAGLMAQAQPIATDTATPERIAEQRQSVQLQRNAIEQAHDARARECWQRFAVNDCLREVRRSRRAALDPLREQELWLNAQERSWRTRQRDERLRDKGSDVERQP